MKKIINILIPLLIVASCSNKFSGFKDLGNDTFMKLLSFEDGTKRFKDAKYVKATIQISAEQDLLYYHFSEHILSADNPFKKLMEHLNEGDSAIFYVGKESFKTESKGLNLKSFPVNYLTISLKIKKYYTEKEYQQEAEKTDEELLEQVILKKYLKKMGITSQYKKNGVYVVPITGGKGKSISKGDKVVINYKAQFVNRIEFDNTYNDIAFTFTYGNPDQVIRGLEIAIKGMKKDAESLVVIPSQLAFGDEGSSTRVVPPYTTVVYKLKIVKIE